MTTLTITPNWKNKSARFKGTIAAGEHVAVSIANDDGSGSAYISSTTNLRLRVVDERGRTLAQFPMPPDEGETPDTWTSGTSDLSCELNLNTVQMLAAVPPHATRQLLFVLDAYSEDTPEFTLFFKDCHEVTHWPRRRGEEEPVNLDDYADLIQDFRERIDAAEESIADKVDEANGIVVHADAAKTAAAAARDVASQAAASAQSSATAAGNSASSALSAAQSAAESASLATAVSIAKMRERTGSLLWHNVALSQNDSGIWVMDVDQSTAPDGGLFDAEVKALGTTEARSLASRFADVINVKDFGAKGDGTTDDTAAINAAVAAARSANAYLYFPRGTYNAVGTINIRSATGCFGDGVVKRNSVLFYIRNSGEHRNYIYASVDGGGDGLSSNNPMTFDEAIDFIKTFGVLDGYWTLKLASGTYRRSAHIDNIHALNEYGWTIEGEAADTSDQDMDNWTWSTVFEPYSQTDYANILFFRNCSQIVLKHIKCVHDNSLVQGTSLAFSYGCGRVLIDTCKVVGGSWCGIIAQSAEYLTISNSVLDGIDKTEQMYAVNVYNSFANTNAGGRTRNLIKNASTGLFSQGGRGYVHNDYNDFADCGVAYAGAFSAHVEDNNNTITNCTRRAVYKEHATGSTRTPYSQSGAIVSCDSAVSNGDNPSSQYWFGVNFHNLGTRGRKTYFHNGYVAPSAKMTFNLGDEDATSSELNISAQMTFYNKTDSNDNFAFAAKSRTQFNFYDANDFSKGILGRIVHFVADKVIKIYNTFTSDGGAATDKGVSITQYGILPMTSDYLLGRTQTRWKDVWTENGSAEARLAALETAVLALDPNFVNGRS